METESKLKHIKKLNVTVAAFIFMWLLFLVLIFVTSFLGVSWQDIPGWLLIVGWIYFLFPNNKVKNTKLLPVVWLIISMERVRHSSKLSKIQFSGVINLAVQIVVSQRGTN